MKKALAVLVILMMLVTALPMGALAVPLYDEPLDFTVDSEESGDGWTWDPVNRVLVLSDLDLEVDSCVPAILVPDGTTIRLAAGTTNRIRSTRPGIEVYGSLSVEGSGSLSVESYDAYGIRAGAMVDKFSGTPDPVELVFRNTGAVTVNAATGIYAQGNLSFTGSGPVSVSPNLRPASGLIPMGMAYGYGIEARGDLTIAGGTINANGSGGGLYADGDILIRAGSDVVATGGYMWSRAGYVPMDWGYSRGIESGGSLTISASQVEATGSVGGLDASEEILITGGSDVVASARGEVMIGTAGLVPMMRYSGIGVRGAGVTITGSTLVASGYDFGIMADVGYKNGIGRDITIERSTVRAEGEVWAAMFASGRINLSRVDIISPSGGEVKDIVEVANSQSVSAGPIAGPIDVWDKAAKVVLIEPVSSRGGQAPEPAQPTDPAPDPEDPADPGDPGSDDLFEVTLFIDLFDYEINGKPDVMDVEPFIESGRTFVPVRFVAEAFGATVRWVVDDDSQKVIIEADGVRIEMVIGATTIQVTRNGESEDVVSDVAAFVRGGRTWLPLRAVGEILGASFDYGPKDGPVEWVTFTR